MQPRLAASKRSPRGATSYDRIINSYRDSRADTTLKTSAPLRSHPVAEEMHFLRPLMTQFSPTRFAVVRTPSPGGGDAALALPPGSLEQKPANGAPLFFRNGPNSRPHWAGEPPSRIGKRPRTVPSIVRVTLGFTVKF